MAEPDDNGEDRTLTVAERLAAAKEPARLSRGAMLGRYEIVELLGTGGMGVVYRAHDRELGRDVALKVVVTDEQQGGSRGHTRLMREAQALAQLSHPNVIAVFDVGRVDGGVFIAMELVEGLRLDQWLKAKPRRWREVVALFRDAGRALAAAHAVGLVHRDVKPANIMVSGDTRVRVLDFGLARAADPAVHGERGAATGREPAGRERTLNMAALPSLANEPSQGPVRATDGQPLTDDSAAPPTSALRRPAAGHAASSTPSNAGAATNNASSNNASSTSASSNNASRNAASRNAASSNRATRDGDAAGDSPPTSDERPPRSEDVDSKRRTTVAPRLEAVPTPLPSSRSGASRSGGTLLEAPLTEVGSIVGTPPYMAPEQHLGGACTARSDQFSFCVTFYQALYGERPFDGINYEALVDAISGGHVRPPPPGNHVPSWLRKILLRGLEPDPDKRYPSMDALIDDLGRDPAQRWRRIGVGAGALALVAVAGGGLWRGMHASQRFCGNLDAPIRAAWNDARQSAIDAAFSATRLPYAHDSARNLIHALDGFAASWSAMRTDACEATRVRGVQSGELMDLRMQCLDRRLEDFKADVDLLAAADVRVVENAAQVARALPRVDECADAAALRAPVRPPADPAARARVATVERSLSRAKADLNAGKAADGLALSEPAVREARAIGHRPTEADALYIHGRLLDVDGKYDAAERSLRDALLAAEAGRDDVLAARALSTLVWVVGERRGHYADARELARQAQAKIERQDHAELLLADLDGYLASIENDDGKFDAALARGKEALAIREKVLGKDEPEIAHSLSDLGDIAVQLGRYDEALDDYRRALVIYEKTIGPEHPSVGSVLANVGAVLRTQGRYDEALVQYRRARQIIERALGPDHPNLATIFVNEAAVLKAQGKLDAATGEYQRALELWTKALGADHPNVGTVYYYLGSIALDEGKPVEAIARFKQALANWEAKLGPANPALAAPLVGIGDALRRQHQLASAEAPITRAMTVVEKALGPQHPEMAQPLSSLGELYLDEKKPDRAVPLFERALAIRVANPGDKLEEADNRFALARALRATNRDPKRAHELATQARTAFAAAGANGKQQLAGVDKFLKSR